MLKPMAKAFIYDVETTGLVKNSLIPLERQPRIIEFFGHVVDDSGAVHDEIEFFCDPGIPLDPVITKITGIKQEQLNGQPKFSKFSDQLLRMLGNSDCVVAHNLSFDMALLEADCARCGSPVKWPGRLICTVEQTEWIKGHRLSLTALHEELFGEGFPAAHRARNDVQALTRCYLELRKRGDL